MNDKYTIKPHQNIHLHGKQRNAARDLAALLRRVAQQHARDYERAGMTPPAELRERAEGKA